MTRQSDRPDTASMTRDELIRECRRLGVNPRGGLSRARRLDLESWVSINWRPRPQAAAPDPTQPR